MKSHCLWGNNTKYTARKLYRQKKLSFNGIKFNGQQLIWSRVKLKYTVISLLQAKGDVAPTKIATA